MIRDERQREWWPGGDQVAVESVLGFVRACLYRFEEKGAPRDQWGCFRARDSFLYPCLSRPAADLVVQTLVPRHLGPGHWPEGKRFAVALSHDVDAIRNVSGSSTPDSAYWRFHAYCQTEEEYGFKSAFFVVPFPYGDKINPDYDITKEPLRSTLLEISSRGWEVGLHLGFGSHLDLERIKAEKETLEDLLGRRVLGGRCHYLPFEPDQTPFLMEQAGLIYDTTLGYNEAVGFRSGTSLPHRFLGPDNYCGGVLELPLHVMDGTLFWDMGLGPRKALELMKRITREVESVGGCLNILWHQRVLDNPDYPGWGEVYKDFLRWLATRNAWVTAPGEIALHWIQNTEARFGMSYLEALLKSEIRDHKTTSDGEPYRPADEALEGPCAA